MKEESPMNKILIFCLFLFTCVYANDVYTPQRGTLERSAIMNALRVEVKNYHDIEVIFIVRTLKLKDGWAWAIVAPLSKDGVNHYEEIIALLHKEAGIWKVAELVCTEPETIGCLEDSNFFDDLQKRFPAMPVEILPLNDE
jgi:hypothetical protein